MSNQSYLVSGIIYTRRDKVEKQNISTSQVSAQVGLVSLLSDV